MMNKLDRQKFLAIRINDQVWYTDSGGARCEGIVSGWKNTEGLPALLCGEKGDRVVSLDRVLSRTRGNDKKEWSDK